MKIIKILVVAILTVAATIPSYAVTDKEMDEAKAITAKEYLRWVNDGSGYLDEFSVKSMSDLKAKLKAKEKENLSSFNAVKIPSDYASWDKAKLIEFWTNTFFNSPEIEPKGKGARPKVRKLLTEMKVGAPASENETTQNEQPSDINSIPATENVTENTMDAGMPNSDEVIAQEQDILADQKAIEDDISEAENSRHEEKSNTWVYVLVLSILVAIVIWLVVYAANLMKRQPREEGGKEIDAEDVDDLRRQAHEAISRKDEENKELRERLQKEEKRSAELGMEIERMKLEHSRLLQQMQQLREQSVAVAHTHTVSEPREEMRREPVQKIHREPEEVKKPVETEPRLREVKEDRPILKVIYLGRTNRRGIFVRADRRINPGNTIYRLDTNDGLVGTFHVVDEPEIIDVALSNPIEYLAGGCTGEDLQDTAGVTRIVTVSAGTAIFENGYWKVLRKAEIRYE